MSTPTPRAGQKWQANDPSAPHVVTITRVTEERVWVRLVRREIPVAREQFAEQFTLIKDL